MVICENALTVSTEASSFFNIRNSAVQNLSAIIKSSHFQTHARYSAIFRLILSF